MVIIEEEVSLIMGESIQCSQNRFDLGVGLLREEGGDGPSGPSLL